MDEHGEYDVLDLHMHNFKGDTDAITITFFVFSCFTHLFFNNCFRLSNYSVETSKSFKYEAWCSFQSYFYLKTVFENKTPNISA